jgi:hypothetical protein
MKMWVHRNSLLIYSFMNPNSEKSAEVRSEYPIYISRFGQINALWTALPANLRLGHLPGSAAAWRFIKPMTWPAANLRRPAPLCAAHAMQPDIPTQP